MTSLQLKIFFAKVYHTQTHTNTHNSNNQHHQRIKFDLVFFFERILVSLVQNTCLLVESQGSRYMKQQQIFISGVQANVSLNAAGVGGAQNIFSSLLNFHKMDCLLRQIREQISVFHGLMCPNQYTNTLK